MKKYWSLHLILYIHCFSWGYSCKFRVGPKKQQNCTQNLDTVTLNLNDATWELFLRNWSCIKAGLFVRLKCLNADHLIMVIQGAALFPSIDMILSI